MAKDVGLQEFLSEIAKNGYAKPSRYVVEFQVPAFVGEYQEYIGLASRDIPSKIRLSVENVDLPSRTITTSEIKQGNFTVKGGYATLYDTVNFTFRCSANMREKKILDAWQAAVIGMKSGNVNFPNRYKTNVTIHVLDDSFEPSYSVILESAFPSIVQSVTLGWGNQNEIIKVSASFVFTKWLNSRDVDLTTEFNTGGVPQIEPNIVQNVTRLGPTAQALNKVRNKITEIGNTLVSVETQLESASGLAQGETQPLYNKLSQIASVYGNADIEEGIRFVQTVSRDIETIEDVDILASDNKTILLAGAIDIVNKLSS